MNAVPKLVVFSGGYICPVNPIPSEILLEDIARGLAYRCRWGGQTRRYYSVAEHSILVACQCSDDFRLWGLLHDAAEAYIGDIPAPMKDLVWFHVPDERGVICKVPYAEVEGRIMEAVIEALAPHLVKGMPDEVHEADLIIREWERREYVDPASRVNSIEVPLGPEDARHEWLSKFSALLAFELEREASENVA